MAGGHNPTALTPSGVRPLGGGVGVTHRVLEGVLWVGASPSRVSSHSNPIERMWINTEYVLDRRHERQVARTPRTPIPVKSEPTPCRVPSGDVASPADTVRLNRLLAFVFLAPTAMYPLFNGNSMGLAYRGLGRHESADYHLNTALRLRNKLGDQAGYPVCLTTSAPTSARKGRPSARTADRRHHKRPPTVRVTRGKR